MHHPDGPLKFKRTKDGLYAFKPSENFKKEVAATKSMSTARESAADGKDFLMSSVSENRKKGYTDRQFNEAKANSSLAWIKAGRIPSTLYQIQRCRYLNGVLIKRVTQ